MSEHPVDPFDPVIAALIRSKAARLAKLNFDPAIDGEDLVQQLLLKLLERRQKFDPERGSAVAFAVRVITNAAASLLRDFRAEKRARPEGETAPQVVADHRETDEELRDLILDVHEMLKRLPQDEQAIATLLSRLKVTDAAREAGVSRSTVYGRRRSLLKQFEREGLSIYLRRIPRTV